VPFAGTLADQLADRRFIVGAAIASGGRPAEAVQAAAVLQAQGAGVFAVLPAQSARTHSDSLDLALHLQQQAGVETIATLTTWDKTIMTLQAELLGAHALGIRNVICTTGSPPVGARVNPGARDQEAEIARARAKVRAGAHFLVSRPVYELDSLLRTVTALEGTQVPLLLSVTPLRSFEEADYLANEVPGVMIPPDTLRAMERAAHGAARATGIELAVALVRQAKKLVSGVIVTVAADDPAVLAPLLAAAG
jgi:homocysteine S-methyltransferase